MRRKAIAILFTAAFLCTGLAQSQNAAKRLAFDVVSVKPDNIDQLTFDYVPRRSGDRIIMHNTQLRMVIAYAYNIPNSSWQVVGTLHLPLDWIWYDIEAIASGSPSDDQIRVMFQTLLKERFKLKVHRETRLLNGYDLVVARGGSKLKPAVPGNEMSVEGRVIEPGTGLVAWANDGAHLVGNGASMEQLVFTLSGRLRGPVTDRTGLTGRFDYNVAFARDDRPSDVNSPPELGVRRDNRSRDGAGAGHSQRS